jgi:hypothetical protein
MKQEDAIIPDWLGCAETELAPDVANFREVQEGTSTFDWLD